MFHLFIRCFTKKYFQFKGRASRKEYLSFLIFNHLVVLLLKILIKITALKITAIFLGAYLLASLSPFILVAVRRMHDINLSGWWGLLLTIIIIVLRLIPDKNNIVSILSIIVLIIVIFQNLRYVIANMLKTLITQQCFIVKHFIISLNSWALYQT